MADLGEINIPIQLCYPCFRNGTEQSVAGYCPICAERFCFRCLAEHLRMSMHTDMPSKYQLCHTNDGESNYTYCFDHGLVVCGKRFHIEHEQCQGKEVSEACRSFNISAEKKSFSADVGLLLKYVKGTSQSIHSNKAKLEKKKQDILTGACLLLEKVTQSYYDFRVKVINLFTHHTSNLSACQSTLDEIETKLYHFMQRDPQTQTDEREFLELLYFAKNVRLLVNKIELLNLKGIEINCTLNTNIQPSVLMESKVGELSLQTATYKYSTEFPTIRYPYTVPRRNPGPSSDAMRGHAVQSVKLTRIDKINVKIHDDKKICLISGVDITIDGNMLLLDIANRKVKLVNPDGIVLSSLRTQDILLDVAVINKTEAAVTMENKQIYIIDIADSGLLSLKRIITMEQYVGGITAYNSNLVVTCDTSAGHPRSVQMIDMRGNVLWTAKTDSEGKNLFDWATFLTAFSGKDDENVIVTDRRKQTITVLDAATGKVVKVCDVEGKTPLGVTVDDNGNVYVCYESGEITVWSRDMQQEMRLTTGSEDFKFPYAMVYNSRRSELVLTGHYDYFIRYHKTSV